MKTQKFIPIVVAIMTAIIFSLEAQNTKSVEDPRNIVFDKEDVSAHRSFPRVLNVKAQSHSPLLTKSSKSGPHKSEIRYVANESSWIMEDVTNELMKQVKYFPEESFVNVSDAAMRFEEAIQELAKEVKYKPSDSMVDPLNENSGTFNDVVAELYKEVKYKPTIIP